MSVPSAPESAPRSLGEVLADHARAGELLLAAERAVARYQEAVIAGEQPPVESEYRKLLVEADSCRDRLDGLWEEYLSALAARPRT